MVEVLGSRDGLVVLAVGGISDGRAGGLNATHPAVKSTRRNVSEFGNVFRHGTELSAAAGSGLDTRQNSLGADVGPRAGQPLPVIGGEGPTHHRLDR